MTRRRSIGRGFVCLFVGKKRKKKTKEENNEPDVGVVAQQLEPRPRRDALGAAHDVDGIGVDLLVPDLQTARRCCPRKRHILQHLRCVVVPHGSTLVGGHDPRVWVATPRPACGTAWRGGHHPNRRTPKKGTSKNGTFGVTTPMVG